MTAVFPGLTAQQANGLACIVCNTPYDLPPAPDHVPVGVADTAAGGGQAFACDTARCAGAVGYTPPGEQLALEEAGR